MCGGRAQISILTSSATRGTFYKQFAGNNENLGDITAKGDAQVAVADLIGMVIGIELARLAGTNALAVWGCYGVLSSLDFWFILKSLDMIVFRFLNLERSFMCAYHYVNDPERAVPTPEELSKQEPVVNRPKRAGVSPTHPEALHAPLLSATHRSSGRAGCADSGNSRCAVRQSYWSDLTKGYWSGTFRGISQTPLTPSRLAGLLEVSAHRPSCSRLRAYPLPACVVGALVLEPFLADALLSPNGTPQVFSGDQYIIVPRRKKCAVLVLRQVRPRVGRLLPAPHAPRSLPGGAGRVPLTSAAGLQSASDVHVLEALLALERSVPP